MNRCRATSIARDRWEVLTRILLAFGVAAAIMAAGISHSMARGAPDSFADLAEKLLPAVVNISTEQEVEGPEGGIPEFNLPPGSPFEDFFERFGQGPDRPRKMQSLGSGFVVDAEAGIVITNNHVVDGADTVTVILDDDTELEAKLLGTDPSTDIAVLKLETDHPLSEVSFGDSDKARVGDWVIAIGNPLGLGGTVTAGIISARGRNINSGPYDDFIQTDAPINRGNSGGPLFNMDGQVIGINTAIFSQTGGSIGIGFSIPSNQAERVIAQIREYGSTRRGWLGVSVEDVSEDIAESIGLEDTRGALVATVHPGQPADQAGFEDGDVILMFDGNRIEDRRSLVRVVGNTPVGKEVDVTVWRKGEKVDLTAKLGQRETQLASVQQNTGEAPAQSPDRAEDLESVGLSLQAITDKLAEEYGIDPDDQGVVVTGVARGSDAEEKGIRPGDIILEANQEKVRTPGDVESQIQAVKDAGKGAVLLKISRAGNKRYLALKFAG